MDEIKAKREKNHKQLSQENQKGSSHCYRLYRFENGKIIINSRVCMRNTNYSKNTFTVT